ncbi:hypothetical protein [Bacillus sp. Marseille-P3661]|uniref:hypothetical protein n=1 Tax=Bacillus sp. Marseille-P3661 TaxID=1936234 RepID=UPI000C841F55|nr:hypothetical protein [Bacillus sp. Marseille-P3661]
MAKHWNDDQIYLLEAIEEYRNVIEGKKLNAARRITKEFAEILHKNTPELQHRIVQSIVERLPYLDNLLAGVFNKENYAKKDQHIYAKAPRRDGSIEINYCNMRHSYNGAIRKS